MAKRNVPASPAPDSQPRGSGAVPGSAQGAEELVDARTGEAREPEPPAPTDVASPDDAELAHSEADTELAQQAEEPMVEYVGEFGRREVTVADWRTANIMDMPTIVWDRSVNNMKVPVSAFTPQALAVLRQDQSFRVS